jgi:hypothetical protein
MKSNVDKTSKTKMKKLILIMVMVVSMATVNAQKQDTVIIELAKTSRVIFTMRDKHDLEILKHYDFNELFKDILKKLEANDTTNIAKSDTTQTEPAVAKTQDEDWGTNDEDDDDDDDNEFNYNRRRHGRTEQSFNFDLGTNNYLTNGKFPDSENAAFAVKPWGSWYLAASSIQRTRLGKNFFMEWGLGVSWYNFKFENSSTMLQKDDNGVQFLPDTRTVDFQKSKLSASYITASLVPVVDFGDKNEKKRLWEHGNGFRLGVGPYVGYRIGSHTKMVYEKDGHREKDHNKDNFYLNNFRYGARLQIGYRATDLFFNYDLNELFAAGKGPKLNAFSFGVIF